MTPLVSILVPAFNATPTLRDTLRSAIGQTWQHREIIVVDDGSSDDTAMTAREFQPYGVRVETQAHAGAAAARNKALLFSSGDYVQWLDADDLLAPDKIERQIRALSRCTDRTVLSSSWGCFWYRPSRARFNPTGLWCDLEPLEWLLRKMEEKVYMQTAAWLVPRRLTEDAGPWNTRLSYDDDGEYFCRVLLLADHICFVPDAQVLYRMTGHSSVSYVGHSFEKMKAQIVSARLNIGYLRSLQDSPRVRRACVRYLQNTLFDFYPERPDLVAEATQLAGELGGELQIPRFSWKYRWLAATCGPLVAKRAQVRLRRTKWTLYRQWERAMHGLENVITTSATGVADRPRGSGG